MKKGLLFLIATTLFAASCSTDNFDEATKPMELKTSTLNKRSYSEALEIANNAISMLGDNAVTRSGFPRQIDEQHGVKYVTNRITRIGAPDTLLYIFNFEGEEGFAVVSANKNTDGLLAVTESGCYNPEEGTNNPGLDMFMNMAAGYVSTKGLELPETPEIPLLRYKTVIDTIYKVVISPRISVEWGQSGIYGQFCPNGFSGCANSAMAMAMSYYAFPTTLEINYEGITPFTLTLNWLNIKNHTSSYYYCSCSTETHNAIGYLLRQLGYMTNSTYYFDENGDGINDGTGTYFTNVISVLRSIGYTVGDETNYNSTDLSSILNNGKLILMGGSNANSNTGHMWVVDGCNYYTTETQDYVSSNGFEWSKIGTPTYRTTAYNHINWGWDGSANGYFNNGVFDPNGNNYSEDITYTSIYH